MEDIPFGSLGSSWIRFSLVVVRGEKSRWRRASAARACSGSTALGLRPVASCHSDCALAEIGCLPDPMTSSNR